MASESYTKKPVTIEARQLTKEAALAYWGERTPFWPGEDFSISGSYHLGERTVQDAFIVIDTLEGKMRAGLGDYIIKGVKGEFYPCKPDIFAATYDPAGRAQDGSEDSRQEEESCANGAGKNGTCAPSATDVQTAEIATATRSSIETASKTKPRQKNCDDDGHMWGPGNECIFCHTAKPSQPEAEGGDLPALDVNAQDSLRLHKDNPKTNAQGRRFALMLYCRERQLRAANAELAELRKENKLLRECEAHRKAMILALSTGGKTSPLHDYCPYPISIYPDEMRMRAAEEVVRKIRDYVPSGIPVPEEAQMFIAGPTSYPAQNVAIELQCELEATGRALTQEQINAIRRAEELYDEDHHTGPYGMVQTQCAESHATLCSKSWETSR